MKNGIIDVGSNSVRLLFDGEKYMNNTQLAEDLIHTGVLKETAIKRTVDAIEEFYRFAKEKGADKVYAFATEAVRAAKNREEFIDKLNGKIDGFELIPSEKEAELGFNGAYCGGRVGVMDIGGASSEIAVGDERGLLYSHSLPLGSVRLKDYAPGRKEQFDYAKIRVKEYGEVPKFEKLISIGGSISVLAAVKLGLEPYDPEIIHGFTMTYDDVKYAVDKILAVPVEKRTEIKGLHPKKILVAPAGGLIALAIMEYLGVKELVLSERDNLEGYAAYRGIEI